MQLVRTAQLVTFARQRFGTDFGDRVRVLSTARPAYGGQRLRARSLHVLLRFLDAQDHWRLPDVLLAPNGNIQTQWRSGPRRIVAQFLPTDEVWFTVIENGQLRITGRRAPEAFVAALAADAPVEP